MTVLLLAFLGTVICWQPVWTRERSVPGTELIEGAKKEEKLVVYATMELPHTVKVIHEFFQKYQFLDIEIHPLEAEALVDKIQNEARAGMRLWDVALGGGGAFQPLFEQNLIASYRSPQRQGVTEALLDQDGYWSGYYINPYVLGYNTALVKEPDIPKSYDALLDPRWQGNQIAIDSTAHALLRGLTPIWGEDKAVSYLKRLAEQRPLMARESIAAVEAMLRAQVALVLARAPVIQGYKRLGSPIGWIPLEPTVAQIDAAMLSAHSPHPNAGRLFVDFILSADGQSAFRGIQHLPVRRDDEARPENSLQGYNWFVELPDKHVKFHKTVRLFREIFGIK